LREGVIHAARIVATTSFLMAMITPAALAAESLAERVNQVHQVLERRGLGTNALTIIDNILSHEGAPPPAAPSLVRALLKAPLTAVDAAALFDQAVPQSLRALGDAHAATPRVRAPVKVLDLLAPYIDEVAAAQRVLRSAVAGNPIDAPMILKALDTHPPSADILHGVMRAVDVALIARANALFLDATARLATAMRAAEGDVHFSDTALRFESAIGVVVIGTRGDDDHAADAALIIDPGGNDTYTRAPAVGGAVSIIIDLAGNDRYRGADVVVHGLSVLIDFVGNDRYEMTGSGLGAAIAGASVLLDFAGDDVYQTGVFAQGAAAFGLGAVIDFDGNDRYQLRAGGQGFGMAGGIGLLWDRAGNDSYTAAGMSDTFDRGGGISLAQGAATGYRTGIGGGIGLLRDDAGDDTYSAEMFAQGVGYYYGVGLLWDRGGNDQYRAVRYAQGSGVHEAIGVLHDEAGNDRYTASVGVAQGMGLDLALGVLYDGAGDDRYGGDVLVQGAATANGIGIVIDRGGADQWQTGADRRAWGRAEWFRGLPTLGFLLHESSRAASMFIREGKPYTPRADSAALGGPLGGELATHEAATVVPCPKPDATQSTETPDFSAALARLVPGFSGGKADATAFAAAYAEVRRHVVERLGAALGEMAVNHFGSSWALGHALTCVARDATATEIESLWSGIEQRLESGSAFAAPLMNVLRERPPPAARLRRILIPLDAHASCAVRATRLRLLLNAEADTEWRQQVIQDAQIALGDSCVRLQLAGRDALRRLLVSFDAGVLPQYLRGEVPAAP
jgi:hypothetical protein